MEWVLGNPGDRSPAGFRARHGSSRGPMSVAFYNKRKRKSLGPRETVVGTTIIILPEGEKAWDLDPQRTALRELIAALARNIGVGTEFTAAEVHQRIQIVDARGVCANQDLFDVFSHDGKRTSPKSIGSTLMSARDKISD